MMAVENWEILSSIHNDLKLHGFTLEQERQIETDQIVEASLGKISKNAIMHSGNFSISSLQQLVIYYWAIYNKTEQYIEFLTFVFHGVKERYLLILYFLQESLAQFLEEEACVEFITNHRTFFEDIDADEKGEIDALRDIMKIKKRNPHICEKEDSKEEYHLLTFETLSVFPITIEDNSLIPSEKSMLEEMTESQKEVVSYYCFNEEVLKKIKILIENHIDDEKLLDSYILEDFNPEQILLFSKEQIEMIRKVHDEISVLDSDFKALLQEKPDFVISPDLISFELFCLLHSNNIPISWLGSLSDEGEKKLIKYFNIHKEELKDAIYYDGVHIMVINRIIHIIKKDIKRCERQKTYQKV